MKLRKPEPPQGYVLLKNGKSKNRDDDLVWVAADDFSVKKWTPAKLAVVIETSPLATGKIYYEPKVMDSWNLFRCRKEKV